MKPVLVAIAGGSGAGKTWVAHELIRRLAPHAAVLSLDDFYRDLADLNWDERVAVNFDDPNAIDWRLFIESLRKIKAGKAADIPRYNFARHTRHVGGRRWKTKPVVVVEGLWPFWRRDLKALYDLRVFKKAEPRLRLARRTRRDVRERGRTGEAVERQWKSQVAPMYRRFVRPQAVWADVLLPGVVPERRLERIAAKIRALARLPARKPIGSEGLI